MDRRAFLETAVFGAGALFLPTQSGATNASTVTGYVRTNWGAIRIVMDPIPMLLKGLNGIIIMSWGNLLKI